ncbi:cation:proton antiporter [Dongia sp.]|uniref:cation:proton antiporter domain-containing protein n=1 Tax=Dongia sp. TaxID=1977262 RepID=UPI0035B25563
MTTIGLVVFGLVSLLALMSLLPPLAARLRLPYSVLLAVVGFILGAVVSLRPDQVIPSPMLHDIFDALGSVEISSEAFILIFLPTLLFEVALAIDVRRLIDDIAPVLTMAVVAVVICALTVGVALATASPFGLVACLLLGSIVATTDPAAVVGIFREVGVPKRLTTLVEGESLLNDAAAIALFTLLLEMQLSGGEGSIGGTIFRFLESFGGGALAGLILARAACALFPFLGGWPRAEITLTIALAYLSFVVPEHYFHVSGVVSCVTAGLVLGSTGKTRMSAHTFEQMEAVWSQLGFWANSLIFLLAAMFVPRIMEGTSLTEIGFILLVFLATLAARAITVFALLPLLTRAGLMQRINNRIKTVIVWGGLRGAVSLALALAVIENAAVPAPVRDFIATSVTGFVLMTLFINGITLRPLVNFFRLNRLNPVARGVRDRAKLMTLTDVAGELNDIARTEGVDREIADAALSGLEARLGVARARSHRGVELMADEMVKVGLTVAAAFEVERCFALLNGRIVDRRIAEMLLREAQHVREAVRASGRKGYIAAAERGLGFNPGIRFALWLQRRLRIERPLADALADRFEFLMMQRRVLSGLVPFSRDRLQPLIGEEAAAEIIGLTARRIEAVERSLLALKLQYPAYAAALQRQYLGRIARQRESAAYESLAANLVVSGEVERELKAELEQHWTGLDERCKLDPELSAVDLVGRVPIFRDLDIKRQQAIAHLLTPQLVLPDSVIVRRGEKGDAMYFVASGAVRVVVEPSVELGSGEFFGELALLTGHPRNADVVALGYCKLLALKARDFQRLLAQDAGLKARIEQVAQERLNVGERLSFG